MAPVETEYYDLVRRSSEVSAALADLSRRVSAFACAPMGIAGSSGRC